MGRQRKFTTEELIGTQVGAYLLKNHYTQLDTAGRNQHWWTCECVCGATVEKAERRIIHNKSSRCSCNYVPKPTKEKSKLWRGVGDLSGAYFSTIRLNAREKGCEFSITIQEIWDLFIAQGKACALSGVPIYFTTKNNDGVKVEHQTASLDRIDSEKGYILSNVWWVHKDANRMKNAYSVGTVVDFCYRVTERFPREMADNKWILAKNAKVN